MTVKKKSSGIVLLILAVLTLIYWMTALNMDVYRLGFMGAIFELLWLPMIVSLGVIPIMSAIRLVKTKPLSMVALVTLLVSLASIATLAIFGK
jgi:hypothetical protein